MKKSSFHYFMVVFKELVKNKMTDARGRLFRLLKVGLSPSKKICVICLIEIPLKLMKNVFYFTLKALFALKIFKILSWHFGHTEKTVWLKR